MSLHDNVVRVKWYSIPVFFAGAFAGLIFNSTPPVIAVPTVVQVEPEAINIIKTVDLLRVQLALANQRAERAENMTMLTNAKFGELLYRELAKVGVYGDPTCSERVAGAMRAADSRLQGGVR